MDKEAWQATFHGVIESDMTEQQSLIILTYQLKNY